MIFRRKTRIIIRIIVRIVARMIVVSSKKSIDQP